MKQQAFLVTCTIAITLVPWPAQAEGSLWQAVGNGKVSGGLRLRSESADDSVNKSAHGLTLRTRLRYTSKNYSNLSGTIEFDDVRIVAGQDRYAPERFGYAQVADLEGSELNQAFVSYRVDEGLDIALGRQRILVGNERFVGAGGWRQDDQTFDAFSINYDYHKLKATYTYIDKINGITAASDANVAHHIASVVVSWSPALSASVYGLYLDANEVLPLVARDSRTLGVRLDGSVSLKSPMTLSYTAEFAQQNAGQFEPKYFLAEAGVAKQAIKVTLGYEILGSDNGDFSFQTPLATLHAFNGWADKFTSTPTAGLHDIYTKVNFPLRDAELTMMYHKFNADKGSAHYADEIDVMVGYSISKNVRLGVKYADYMAEEFSADTTRLWVWMEVTF